jgi:starch synthase
MRILLASSEVYPYSKTGGLADMVGALGRSLAGAGNQVGLVTPLYGGIRERLPALEELDFPLEIPLGSRRERAFVWTLETQEGLMVYFVDHPDYFQRAGLYQQNGADYPDNPERFMFFSKAVADLALHLSWKPELVHVHDWQVGFVPLLLRHRRGLAGWESAPRSCLTIHNLAYQGLFPAYQYPLSNLPWDYFTPSGVEFYGQGSFLKTGIAFADALTTVSPRYAREITTEEFGCGLDGLLRERGSALTGILNGVDIREWDPTRDPYLPHSFSADRLEGKTACKLALQKELGLSPDPETPLFGNIGRMVMQKGMDILIGALEEMLPSRMQFVVLGSGEPNFQRAFMDLAQRYPSKIVARIGYDEALSHRIEAGCDFYLMPSQFEPCGLNQMYSLRFGTIPIVRITGGLDDTVLDVRENQTAANGIKFGEYSSQALSKAIRKALVLYEQRELFKRFRSNAMGADFSWDKTTRAYEEVYESTLAKLGQDSLSAVK